MPKQLDSLLKKRSLLLQEMQAIDRLRRGSLSKQYFKPHPGQTEQRGPYFLLQGFFRGKKFSERIPAEHAPQVQEQVDNYRRFQTLAEDYVTLSDEITQIDRKIPTAKKGPTPGTRRRTVPGNRSLPEARLPRPEKKRGSEC